jgi:hypothetical protein
VLYVYTVSFKAISTLNFLASFFILIFEFFSLFYKSLNLLFGKSPFVVSNSNFRILRCSLINSCHVHNSIGINLERYLNLRNTSWSRRNTIQVKFTKRIVVSSHLSFSLKHLNTDSRLIVSICSEDLRFFNRNS